MPKGAVYVGRPTKWGNPFRVGDGRIYKIGAVTGLALTPADAVRLYWLAVRRGHYRVHTPSAVGWVEHPMTATVPDVQRELTGRNLACWCPLDDPCHADVLLEIANGT
ncbi:hypothetical protein BH11ACT6_BH11ACT6_34640 [soil metagenome]